MIQVLQFQDLEGVVSGKSYAPPVSFEREQSGAVEVKHGQIQNGS